LKQRRRTRQLAHEPRAGSANSVLLAAEINHVSLRDEERRLQ